MFILDPYFLHLGSWILDSKTTKMRGGGFLLPVFVVNNFTKLYKKNYLKRNRNKFEPSEKNEVINPKKFLLIAQKYGLGIRGP
jgi:hypothetical protein